MKRTEVSAGMQVSNRTNWQALQKNMEHIIHLSKDKKLKSIIDLQKPHVL